MEDQPSPEGQTKLQSQTDDRPVSRGFQFVELETPLTATIEKVERRRNEPARIEQLKAKKEGDAPRFVERVFLRVYFNFKEGQVDKNGQALHGRKLWSDYNVGLYGVDAQGKPLEGKTAWLFAGDDSDAGKLVVKAQEFFTKTKVKGVADLEFFLPGCEVRVKTEPVENPKTGEVKPKLKVLAILDAPASAGAQ